MYEKFASVHLHILVSSNRVLRSLQKAKQEFSAELLSIFSVQSWQLLYNASSLQYRGLRENYVFGETEKSHRHHRAMLAWAQQLWGRVMVKYTISSKI